MDRATATTSRQTARRFEYWEKSYAGLLGLGAAIDYALDCGIEALVERGSPSSPQYARDGLATIPGVARPRPGRAAAASSPSPATGIAAADLAAHIKAAGVNVSLSTPDYARRDFDATASTGLVRVSPHAYNTDRGDRPPAGDRRGGLTR